MHLRVLCNPQNKYFCKHFWAFDWRNNVLSVMKYWSLRYYLVKLYVWTVLCLQLSQSLVVILTLREKCGHCKFTLTTCESSVQAHNYHNIFDIPEHWCCWFWRVMITSFNIIVSSSCDQFWQIGMRSHGWQIGFHHSLAVVQINLSSFKIFLSLSVVDCSCALWMHLSISHLLFYATKRCSYFY